MQFCCVNTMMEDCVSLKKITLYIPASLSEEEELMEDIAEWSPEDTELVLTIGAKALKQAKQSLEIRNQEDYVREIRDKYEHEIFLQKERVRLIEEEQESQLQKRLKHAKEVFESMLDSYRKERDEMRVRIGELERSQNTQQSEMDSKIYREALHKVQRELDTMRQVLTEKDKQVDTHRDLFERSITKMDALTQKRDVASIGKIGEGQFRSLAINTFRDFEGFQIRDVCAIGGLGDFHLEFKDMSILVDSKLYTNKVNSTSREKIKRDLLNNEHMHFAWLVSMDTYIERFDKAPFMFEWVNTEKCVCYINCLCKQEEPAEVLRSVWFCCKAIRQMMETEGAERGELSLLKEKEMKMRDILSKMAKSGRERDTLMGQLRRNFDKTDEYMRELLNEETAVVVNDYYRAVVEWWNRNLEESGENVSLKSTAIWTQFKRDMKETIEKTDMDANAFKEILCGFLGGEKVNKPKVKGGALEIMGYKWKSDVSHL